MKTVGQRDLGALRVRPPVNNLAAVNPEAGDIIGPEVESIAAGRQLQLRRRADAKLIFMPARAEAPVPPADIGQRWCRRLFVGRGGADLKPFIVSERLRKTQQILAYLPWSNQQPVFAVQPLYVRTVRARCEQWYVDGQLMKPRTGVRCGA